MALYCWKENVLQIYRNGKVSEISFPESTSGRPVYSRTERYIAVPAEKKLFVYDNEKATMLTIPHKQFCQKNTAVRFDVEDKILSFYGNDIFCHDPVTEESVKLYHAGRSPHNPQDQAASPGGRYISYCRYRSADLRLYVYDRQSGQCLDPKFSVYHYAWLSETQIVYSLSGGIKVLDVQTGKSVTLLRDHRAVCKRCSRKEDADILQPYCALNEELSFVDLDLKCVSGDRICFWLRLYPHGGHSRYDGLWSCAPDGSDTRLHYDDIPDSTPPDIMVGNWREMPYFDSPGR